MENKANEINNILCYLDEIDYPHISAVIWLTWQQEHFDNVRSIVVSEVWSALNEDAK